MSAFLNQIIDPNDQNGGKLDEKRVLADPMLTFAQKREIIDYGMRRTRELASNSEAKSNPEMVRALMLRIHAPDDDESKIYNMGPIMDAYKSGDLSTHEMQGLRREVEQLRDGNTSGFQKNVQNARNVVYTMLSRSALGQAMPEVASDAAYRFSAYMESQIEEYRRANKNPRDLLDPTSPVYLMKPALIQSFMNTSSNALSSGASKVAQQESAAMPTYKEYDSLPKGAQFKDPQGNVRVKP
jgi:hypothetical protein